MSSAKLVIRQALENREATYKNLCGVKWKLSHLYFFLVTPSGKDKKFKDYVPTLKRDMLALKPYNYSLWIKEKQNTNHVHGIISVKSDNYKFKKMLSDKYVFQATPMVSASACISYMCKHSPKKLYILYQLKHYSVIQYDRQFTHVNEKDLKIKLFDLNIKLPCLKEFQPIFPHTLPPREV